ncbi:ExbD/TolR family protein [Methylotenera versatilis]|uniref:ExbD/TolR family protein n=1 Tax=Methylotenera versatilis TaxID=1055487 RepID=UPI00064704C5|nr:biopolymer transporter ExbD [Methylotenera versatilis]
MAFSSQSDGDEVMSEINVTPLVDVMLVLLVAFIVTVPVMTNAIQVNLPKTAATKPPEPSKPITISVNAEGNAFINQTQVELPQLETELIARQATNPEQVYHLSSDESVKYGSVAKVMAVIERSGITKLAVLTQNQ